MCNPGLDGSIPKHLLRRVGLEITRHPAPNTLPWQIRRILVARTVDGVIDVGAHQGEFARSLRSTVGFVGPIVSFEPSSSSYEILPRAMAADHAWSGQRCALGQASSTMDLNLYNGTDFNSFRQASVLGRQRWKDALTLTGTESVPVRRLDEVLELPGELILKSDTQGYDLEVLNGASGLLDRVVAIIVELPIRPVYEGAPVIDELIRRLDSDGFELLGLFPLSHDSDGLRVVEFDGVFLRS